jgi:hypothetical protein
MQSDLNFTSNIKSWLFYRGLAPVSNRNGEIMAMIRDDERKTLPWTKYKSAIPAPDWSKRPCEATRIVSSLWYGDWSLLIGPSSNDK